MIILILLSLLLIVLSSFCNAIMDTLDHHYSTSIFSKIEKNPLWWNADQGWKNKYVDRDPKKGRVKWNILGIRVNKPVQITDAWHFFKMLMIIFFCSASVVNMYFAIEFNVFISIGILIIYGTLWNLPFSLLYNKVLINK